MTRNASLKGKKIVLTGKFASCSRKQAEALLKQHGAATSSSVSGKTDLVIAGAAAGSKLYDAHRLGVPILAEAHLQRLLAGAPLPEVVALARTFYTLERSAAAEPGALNLLRGAAPGVGATRWPSVDGAPMDHLFTLDLATMPALASHYPEHRAISVFCSRADELTMYDIGRPDNGETAIVFTTQAQLDERPAPPPGERRPAGSFRPVARRWDELPEHFGGTRVLGGVPSWCQDEEHQGNFILQCGEDLAVAGDGLVYVFDDRVFAQFT